MAIFSCITTVAHQLGFGPTQFWILLRRSLFRAARVKLSAVAEVCVRVLGPKNAITVCMIKLEPSNKKAKQL